MTLEPWSKERGIVIWGYRRRDTPGATPRLVWDDAPPAPSAPDAPAPTPEVTSSPAASATAVALETRPLPFPPHGGTLLFALQLVLRRPLPRQRTPSTRPARTARRGSSQPRESAATAATASRRRPTDARTRRRSRRRSTLAGPARAFTGSRPFRRWNSQQHARPRSRRMLRTARKVCDSTSIIVVQPVLAHSQISGIRSPGMLIRPSRRLCSSPSRPVYERKTLIERQNPHRCGFCTSWSLKADTGFRTLGCPGDSPQLACCPIRCPHRPIFP